MANQAFADRLAAAARVREARIASGEDAVRKLQKKLNFAIWGISTQTAVSAQSAALGQKILRLVAEGNALAAGGQPDTMPAAAWDAFRESLAVGESWAQRHIAAWRDMQEYTASAGPAAGMALVTGRAPAPESHLLRNLAIAGGVAGTLGVGYLIISKLRRKGGH
jgi:hypothetical protein